MQNSNNHDSWYTPPNFHRFMPQVQSLQPSHLRTPEPAQQEAKIREETKAKRERWTARQAEVLVSLWVENFKALEYSRCNQVWPKLVNKVYSLGPTKTFKQCKVKMRNLKDTYKKCKNENKQSGNERRSCAFYEEFDRVLSFRNVVKLPKVCEVGVAEDLAQSPQKNQANEFEENKENRKRKTLDLKESLESEDFVDELEEAVKSKKIKGKKDVKKHFTMNCWRYKNNSSNCLRIQNSDFKHFSLKCWKSSCRARLQKSKGTENFFCNLAKC